MIDALLATWPVPDGHVGEVRDSRASDQTWIEIKHLLAAGLLTPGTRLIPRPGQWASTEATILPDGRLDVAGTVFDSPSGAGKHVKGAVANGWVFWRLEDGRSLSDVRAVYRGEKPENARNAFDWTLMHTIPRGPAHRPVDHLRRPRRRHRHRRPSGRQRPAGVRAVRQRPPHPHQRRPSRRSVQVDRPRRPPRPCPDARRRRHSRHHDRADQRRRIAADELVSLVNNAGA